MGGGRGAGMRPIFAVVLLSMAMAVTGTFLHAESARSPSESPHLAHDRKFPTEEIRHKPAFSVLSIFLAPGCGVKAESGAMVCSQNVVVETELGGSKTGASGEAGCFSSLGRALWGGQSIWVTRYFGKPDSGGWVWLAPPGPGDIEVLELNQERQIFIQRGSFLGSWENVQTNIQNFGFRGIFSGEGMFFLRAHSVDGARGRVYIASYGGIDKLTIKAGDEILVDTGHVVAFDDTLTFSICKMGGLKNMFLSGEGLVCKFKVKDRGPRTREGCVWIQTRVPLMKHGAVGA